jgi:broad specificity phosphatase PhoE
MVLDDDHPLGNVAIVSHGAVGTLYLCYLTHVDISRGEAQPGAHGGNYYCFRALSPSLVHGWKPIDGC